MGSPVTMDRSDPAINAGSLVEKLNAAAHSDAIPGFGCADFRSYRRSSLSRRAFPITDTELKLIAAAAIIGLKRIPNQG